MWERCRFNMSLRHKAQVCAQFNLVLSHWGSDTAAKVSRIQRGTARAGRCHGARLNNEVGRTVRRRAVETNVVKEKKITSCTIHWWTIHPCVVTDTGRIHTWQLTPKTHPAPSLHLSRSLCWCKRANNNASTHACSLRITFITTFIIIYMTICVGLHSEAQGWPGLALKGSGACWDCGLLREWHSGRRCPAGRASGGCSMVNRPFMVGPQSLLSWANSSSPAWRDGEGGGAPWRGILGLGVPIFFFYPQSPCGRCSAVQSRVALVWDSHKQTEPRAVATTPKHWQSAKCWQPAAQHWKTAAVNDSSEHLEAGITCQMSR